MITCAACKRAVSKWHTTPTPYGKVCPHCAADYEDIKDNERKDRRGEDGRR